MPFVMVSVGYTFKKHPASDLKKLWDWSRFY